MVTEALNKVGHGNVQGGRLSPIDPPIDVRPMVSTAGEAIEQKVRQLGGERALGGLDRKEPTAWYFRDRSCVAYDARSKQAFLIKGAIYDKWVALGGMSWGVPSTDETTTPDGVGRFNHFSHHAKSIYWTPGTGAHAIWGDIRKRWEQLGWERSYLGYPTSDEEAFADNGRANTFQHGGIYWWPDTGAIDLRDVVLHYTGLYCFTETSHDQSSNSDEPYAIISIATPKITSTAKTRIYSDVDSHEARPDLLELYRGKPYGVTIGIAMMEHDFGDPNKYLKEVQDAVMKVHQAGTLALGLIPIVGPAIAAVAGPALGRLMPAIGIALNNAFGWGDDRIGSGNFTISARDMVLLAARTGNSQFHGIGFKAESPMLRGGGASYKLYFGLVPL